MPGKPVRVSITHTAINVLVALDNECYSSFFCFQMWGFWCFKFYICTISNLIQASDHAQPHPSVMLSVGYNSLETFNHIIGSWRKKKEKKYLKLLCASMFNDPLTQAVVQALRSGNHETENLAKYLIISIVFDANFRYCWSNTFLLSRLFRLSLSPESFEFGPAVAITDFGTVLQDYVSDYWYTKRAKSHCPANLWT